VAAKEFGWPSPELEAGRKRCRFPLKKNLFRIVQKDGR